MREGIAAGEKEGEEMTFKIERNIPVPTFRGKYPMAIMEIGDSFFVSGDKAKVAQRSASNYGRKYNKIFTSRSMDGGIRIWRVK